jgi:hypothetical protein
MFEDVVGRAAALILHRKVGEGDQP